MSTETDWSCNEADHEGFVAFEWLQERSAELSKAEFERIFPVPVLHVLYRADDTTGDQTGDQHPAEAINPHDSGVQLLTVSIRSAAVLKYLGRVAFVCKKPGNPFAHLISVGRSSNNDITIAVDSVSKVHGYFVADTSGWSFTDHGSTNGSFRGESQLESGEKYALESGDIVRVGLEVMLEFLTPAALYDRLRRHH